MITSRFAASSAAIRNAVAASRCGNSKFFPIASRYLVSSAPRSTNFSAGLQVFKEFYSTEATGQDSESQPSCGRRLKDASTQRKSRTKEEEFGPENTLEPKDVASSEPTEKGLGATKFTTSELNIDASTSVKEDDIVEFPSELKDMPANVIAAYMAPLQRPKTYGIKVAQLQLRSYETHGLDFFADFCQRVAYYLRIPMTNVVRLPTRRQLWTLNRSPFVHKRSMENFERKTHSRLLTCYDASAESIQAMLTYIHENSYPGIGIRATVFQRETLKQAIEDCQSEPIKGDKISRNAAKWFAGGRSSVIARRATEILRSPGYARLMKQSGAALPEGNAKLQSEDTQNDLSDKDDVEK